MISPWCVGWVFWWRVKSVLLLTSVGVDHAQGQYQFLFFQELMDDSRVLLGESTAVSSYKCFVDEEMVYWLGYGGQTVLG